MGDMKTPFKDAVVPAPSPSDAGWGCQSNGLDIQDGRAGTPGIMKETTLVDVEGGIAAGASAQGLGDKLAGNTNRTSKDLA